MMWSLLLLPFSNKFSCTKVSIGLSVKTAVRLETGTCPRVRVFLMVGEILTPRGGVGAFGGKGHSRKPRFQIFLFLTI